MSESATDILCELLDERGVEHYDGTESTLWLKDEHGYRASADELSSGRLSVHIWCDTPEQAIAATLGSDDRYDAGFTSGVQAVFKQLEGIEDYEELQCFIAEYRGEGEGYDER